MGERGGRLACVEDLVRQPRLVLREHAAVLLGDLPVAAGLVPLRHQAVHEADAGKGRRHVRRPDLRAAAVLGHHLLAAEEVEPLLLRRRRAGDAAGHRAAADQLLDALAGGHHDRGVKSPEPGARAITRRAAWE